jgi:hypothetical protein
MKVLICGSRNWADEKLVHVVLSGLYSKSPITVIEGGAKGADSFAASWVNNFRDKEFVEHIKVDALWHRYGKAAGVYRNSEMLDLHPDIVIGFSDNIMESKGTKNCLDQAKKRGIKTVLIGAY